MRYYVGRKRRSDDERPRPARAAPAESPARLALKPKAKKPRAQDDPNFIDLKALKKGTRFTIIFSLDETAYGRCFKRFRTNEN